MRRQQDIENGVRDGVDAPDGIHAPDCVEEAVARRALADCLSRPSDVDPAYAGMVVGLLESSLAILRRFWAVAARRNSSLAPFGPRNRSRRA